MGDQQPLSPPSSQERRRSAPAQQQPMVGEILSELFSLPAGEALHGDYSCGISGRLVLHGRLYVCDNFLCFYSNIFGHETKRVIRLAEITRLRKRRTAYVIPALEVSTKTAKYTFGSFFSGGRSNCFKLLTRLLAAKGIVLQSPVVTATPAPADPVEGEGEGEAKAADGEAAGRSGDGGVPITPARLPSRLQDGAVPTPDTEDGVDDSDGDDSDGEGEEVEEGGGGVGESKADGTSDAARARQLRSDTAGDVHVSAPTQALEGPDDTFPDVPDGFWETTNAQHQVLEATLDVAPSAFFSTFVAEDGAFAFLDYHRKHGDFELAFSPWVAIDDVDAKAGLCRTVRFRTPLSGAFLPSSTAVEQAQQYRRYKGHTYVYDFSNRTFDVPYGDYFTTEDRWVVRPSPTDPNKTHLVITNNVVFSKSTLFKRKIISSSREGVGKSFAFWLDLAKAFLAENGPAAAPAADGASSPTPAAAPEPATPAAMATPTSPVPPADVPASSATSVTLPVWAVVLVLILSSGLCFIAGSMTCRSAPTLSSSDGVCFDPVLVYGAVTPTATPPPAQDPPPPPPPAPAGAAPTAKAAASEAPATPDALDALLPQLEERLYARLLQRMASES